MVKNMKTIIIFCILLFASCEKLITWDEFTLQQTRYQSVQLRIDGYYMQITPDKQFKEGYCLYRNGVLLNMNGSFFSEKEMNEYITQRFIQDNKFSSIKPCWGLFIIKENIIMLENYYINDDINKRAYIREGTIINDSTFHIAVFYRSDGSESREIDETYHFRAFTPKPDSTNNFIK